MGWRKEKEDEEEDEREDEVRGERMEKTKGVKEDGKSKE